MKATTFRLSLCALLIFGTTAKPYIVLEKMPNEVIQETVSKYDTKKMHVGVEPKDVSPGGNVWKVVVAEQYEPPLKAEEDKKEVDMDPVVAEVNSEEPEQDWDDVYHKHSKELLQYLAPLRADYKADAVLRIFYSEPEKDEDEVYHRDNQYSEVQTESEQKIGEHKAARVYLRSEEDKDDLYHSEPEEDLDDLYHQ